MRRVALSLIGAADPPPGHEIHLGHKTLRVVAVRDDDADSPPVLVVEEVS
jgi:hypothetical protein